LSRAVELAPRFADGWFYLGLVRAEAGDPRRAMAAYEHAVEADPYGLPDAWFYLGEAAFNARETKTARSVLATYLERFPDGGFVARAHQLLEAKPKAPNRPIKNKRGRR
jgi:tetratricopeptide (TPR) repeat protein